MYVKVIRGNRTDVPYPENTLIPPAIIHHGGRPDDYKEIINQARIKLHLRKQNYNLLKYYADSASGFTPSLALIQRETGIHAKEVSAVRKRLVDKGLILYDRKIHMVCILWNAIKALAN